MIETPDKCVLLVGAPPCVRDVLTSIRSPRRVGVQELPSLEECLEVLGKISQSAAIVAELDGNAGEELEHLAAIRQQYPQSFVLVLVHHGDIRTTVRAMKTGACDCLEAPVESDRLKEIVERLLGSMDSRPPANPLTPMETIVLHHILQGKTSRQIAHALCRSPRTIEVHRSHIMHKLGVSTMVDLVKAAWGVSLLAGSYREASRFEDV